jgi:hypothetical protein
LSPVPLPTLAFAIAMLRVLLHELKIHDDEYLKRATNKAVKTSPTDGRAFVSRKSLDLIATRATGRLVHNPADNICSCFISSTFLADFPNFKQRPVLFPKAMRQVLHGMRYAWAPATYLVVF